MTTVVNLNENDYDVYIGRAGKGKSGYFGNDHPIGYCPICRTTHDRTSAIAAFKKDFNARIEEDDEYRKQVLTLKEQRLGCFCKSSSKEVECHGDVFKEWLDNQE